ncbi:UNVERIFIED_CONTAM: hypothetical protein K2H54_000107 [Gekko kuhli]
MGSVLTFKCDPAGGYRFQLAAGTYDVYAQNDLCSDNGLPGDGGGDGTECWRPLNSILVDSGINLTPPLLERAVEAMNRSESAARATEQDKQQTGSDVIATEQASNSAAKHANAAAASALVAGNAEKGVTEKAADVDQNTRRVADQAARVEVQSAGVAKSAATIAQQSLAVAAIEKAVTEMRDVVVTKTTAAQSAATNAGSHASNAEKAALATESAKVVTLEKAGRVDTQAQQVSADSNLVREYAGQVATHAATVAEQAKEVITNAGAVSQAKTAVQGMQKTVVVKTAQAQAAADTASAAAHRHSWTELDGIPATAHRWPTWDEVTSKPALAMANHSHSGAIFNPSNLQTNRRASRYQSPPKTLFHYHGKQWFAWNKPVEVMRSPIAQDQYNRVYYTDGEYPKLTFDAIATGGSQKPTAWYRLGVTRTRYAPPTCKGSLLLQGGKMMIPQMMKPRFYVETYVTGLGEEGPPGPASSKITLTIRALRWWSACLRYQPIAAILPGGVSIARVGWRGGRLSVGS